MLFALDGLREIVPSNVGERSEDEVEWIHEDVDSGIAGFGECDCECGCD